MDALVQQNQLIIDDIVIPLLATIEDEMVVDVSYLLHGPYIYRLSQRNEAHLLRRILINGLLPEYRLCRNLITKTPKRKINHPMHLQKFGQAFLKCHHCVLPDGTKKNCWTAYRDGDFNALGGLKKRFIQLMLPKIEGCFFSCFLAFTCFYTCAGLLGHPMNGIGLVLLLFLTTMAAIPFTSRIISTIRKFNFLILPGVLVVMGAVLEKIGSHGNDNVFIVLWTSLGSIGTILCLGMIGIFSIVMSLMCLIDIFRPKYL